MCPSCSNPVPLLVPSYPLSVPLLQHPVGLSQVRTAPIDPPSYWLKAKNNVTCAVSSDVYPQCCMLGSVYSVTFDRCVLVPEGLMQIEVSYAS